MNKWLRTLELHGWISLSILLSSAVLCIWMLAQWPANALIPVLERWFTPLDTWTRYIMRAVFALSTLCITLWCVATTIKTTYYEQAGRDQGEDMGTSKNKKRKTNSGRTRKKNAD